MGVVIKEKGNSSISQELFYGNRKQCLDFKKGLNFMNLLSLDITLKVNGMTGKIKIPMLRS